MTNQSRRTSLRSLAEILGCTHSALSEAAREGRLTAGVGFDARGRVVVTDADAAAAQWRAVHVERVDATSRRRTVRGSANGGVVWDHRCDVGWNASELIAEHHALGVLVTALVAAAMDGSVNRAVFERSIATRLREVADLHESDPADIERAERELASTITMLEGDQHDDDDEQQERER